MGIWSTGHSRPVVALQTQIMREGFLWKEGHKRKTWKKRYCVVWPRDYEARGMDAPVLFYFEDNESGGKPKGTISLANIKCRVPKSKRKDFEHAFRVDVMGAAEGHNKFIWAPETDEEIIRLLPGTISPFGLAPLLSEQIHRSL